MPDEASIFEQLKTCSAIYAEDKSCPAVNNRFVFNVSYTRRSNNNPEVVVSRLQ
jgi:hypothetical protein